MLNPPVNEQFAILPLKIDCWKMQFPFGARPIFRGEPLVSGRVINRILEKMKILICGILLFLWNHDFVVSHQFKNKDPAFRGLFPNFCSTATTPILPSHDVSRKFLSDQIAAPKDHLHALGFQDTSSVFGGIFLDPQKTLLAKDQTHLGSYDWKTIGMMLRYTVYHFTNQAVHDLGGGNSNMLDFYPKPLGNDPI